MEPPCLQHGTFQSSKRPLTIVLSYIKTWDMKGESCYELRNAGGDSSGLERDWGNNGAQHGRTWVSLSLLHQESWRQAILHALRLSQLYRHGIRKGGARSLVFRFFLHVVYIYMYIYIQMHTDLSSIALYYITLYQLHRINILYHVITWYIILSLFIIVIIMIVKLLYWIMLYYIVLYHVIILRHIIL